MPRVRSLPGHAPGDPRHVEGPEVELVVRHQIGPVAAEALDEQLLELRRRDVAAEQLLARRLVGVLHHDDLVVVPRGPVDVHHDGAEAELLGDGGRHRLEQTAQVVVRTHDRGHVEQGPEAGEGAGLAAGGHGCGHVLSYIGEIAPFH